MIVVVDDGIGFAEELQDLLMLHGFLAVVVVTHPHASSLLLLGSARLLILDLSLALTTALGVLKELGTRGKSPDVVLVSGSGAEELEQARRLAVERGFNILGALPKPVVPDQLLELIAPHRPSSPRSLTGGATTRWEGDADGIRPMQIVGANSLEHQGMFLSLDRPIDPATIVPQAMGAQRSLSMHGLEGFVVVTRLDELGLSPVGMAAICSSAQYVRQLHNKIIFDLGPFREAPLGWAEDLGAAGFGVLVRVDGAQQLVEASGAPSISTIAMPAEQLGNLGETGIDLAVSTAARSPGLRRITTLCTDIRTLLDLRMARSFGFDMVTTVASAF